MLTQAISYKPIRQVSFEGRKQKPQETQEAPKQGFTAKKAIKVGFILGSAVASYGVFKALVPKAVSFLTEKVTKILPKKAFLSKNWNKFASTKFAQKTGEYASFPFIKAWEGITWASKKSHTWAVNGIENKSPKTMNILNKAGEWISTTAKEAFANIKDVKKIRQSLIETGSVVAAIGGGAQAADMVSSKNVKEV